MCTVTYLPYRNGFILTHNRDEAPTRSPHTISREPLGKDVLLFPRDTKAGGAWIGTTRSGTTACLLNGAFVKHKHEPPYRRSRGLMLLDFFHTTRPDQFFSEYSFEGIEPFTFLLFRPGHLIEFRWDGILGNRQDKLPDMPHFWCSSTLYPPEMQVKRQAVFQKWLQRHDRQFPVSANDRLPAAIYHLHRTGSVNDPENDYIMNRGGRVKTVSITQVVYDATGKTLMRYEDLLENHTHRRQIST